MKNLKLLFTLILLFMSIDSTMSTSTKGDIAEIIFLKEMVVEGSTTFTEDELIDNIKNLKISNIGKSFIKKHEGYREKAYMIGDGMITIGYGHAESRYNSQYKMGDSISCYTAEKLFNEDIKEAEDGVRRILIKRICYNNGNIFITQSMFDALVSMAYNMGVYGLATTHFIDKLITSDDPLATAHMIKTTRIKGWTGLRKRRKGEYELFIKDLKTNMIS